jgi:hypothetical protein
LGGPITGFNRQYLGFTAELCSGWLQQSTDPVLAPGAPGGFPTLYRRGLCGQPEAGGSAYEAIIPAAPSDVSHLILVQPELQGFSVDGTRTVFRIKEGLPVAEGGPSAAPGTGYQVYEESGGALRLVSVLPDGSASGGDNSAGSAHTLDDGRHGSVFRAVSADGTRVYWSTGGTAPLYLRLNAGQDQSAFEAGQCSEAEKACTIKVSSGALAKFLSGSVDGTRALYSEGESLKEFEYDPETGDTTRSTIATGFKGLMGANGDATRAYLASTQQLDGAKGKAGQPNLYFYEAGEEGGFTYIATLAAADALTPSDRGLLSPLSLVPAFRGARVSPDGLHAAFSAVASLTGYDNVDAENGKADAEVFVYDATAPEGEKLHCASCDPSGARPLGRDLAVSDFEYWAAARIPGWGSQLYSSHALSDDGSRLFFDSFQPLVLADTNGVADVYEWEAAGKYCSKESSAFSPAAGGCVRLISSGQSPSGSEFVDADLGGKDVFFKTESSLLPQDPGLIDIYDAREGGGFAPEPPQPAACEGEACQGPVAPPNDPTPASSSLLGTGNANEARPRKKHRKKHQRKRAHKRHAKHDRRASR